MINLTKAIFCLLALALVLSLNLTGALGQEECIVPTIPENVEGIEHYLKLHWAPGHPPAEIQPGTNTVVKVVGGIPPLQWSVSGAGFSLGEVQEGDRVKMLQASPTACGAATITVTDPQNSVLWYVRCTHGTWVLKSNTCEMSGSVSWYQRSPSPLKWYKYEYVKGNKKQYQETTRTYDHRYGLSSEQCAAWCSAHTCDNGIGNCIANYYTSMPATECSYDGWDCESNLFCVSELAYYEWECP
jgi:hypothetical protein